MHNTIACSGGFKYKPTTSMSFSSNCGSLESLNASTRCGFKPRAAQIRCTCAGDTPDFFAIVRTDQCVWPSGFDFRVNSTISSIFDCGIVGLRPRPERTLPSFARPAPWNRERQAIEAAAAKTVGPSRYDPATRQDLLTWLRQAI